MLHAQGFSIVIAGLDPAIHGENLLARLSVRPQTPGVTMDHRVKPGGDAVGSVWPILNGERRVTGPFGT